MTSKKIADQQHATSRRRELGAKLDRKPAWSGNIERIRMPPLRRRHIVAILPESLIDGIIGICLNISCALTVRFSPTLTAFANSSPGLRFGNPGITLNPRRNSFRVAKNLLRHFRTQGFKANPGQEFANAFSVISMNSTVVIRNTEALSRARRQAANSSISCLANCPCMACVEAGKLRFHYRQPV